MRRGWEVTGTYAVVENIEFGPMPDLSDERARWSSCCRRATSCSAIATCTARRRTAASASSTGKCAGATVYTGPGVLDNIVIYNNSIHDNGNLNADLDQDVHGISVSDHVNHLLGRRQSDLPEQRRRHSNQCRRPGRARRTHHLYIGRNVSHDNKQGGFWVKEATDVIFSQNETYGHRPSNSSLGQCMGAQYAPDWVWFIYNHVHDCEYGITQMSDNVEALATPSSSATSFTTFTGRSRTAPTRRVRGARRRS